MTCLICCWDVQILELGTSEIQKWNLDKMNIKRLIHTSSSRNSICAYVSKKRKNSYLIIFANFIINFFFWGDMWKFYICKFYLLWIIKMIFLGVFPLHPIDNICCISILLNFIYLWEISVFFKFENLSCIQQESICLIISGENKPKKIKINK